ncbi:MAG: GNAT family N-acetyltransferase [Deltaproteobacteria bacterium RIFOXYB2_FULL_66_7]|nr:MAG: GNAT family N-acetyltransferase [Deltaproteobacteria bacterium RIFOXYB2_FULL_66_7]
MIRKARMSDVKGIHGMIAEYARKGDMLPRSLADIYENLRDYFIFEDDDGELVGSAAIHIMWEDLAEVRSLAVREGKMRRGIGTQLVESCISEAIVLGIGRVFALTYKPEFFEKLGFHVVDKAELPQKIWTDCLKCSKFPDCDEVALVADFSGRRRG